MDTKINRLVSLHLLLASNFAFSASMWIEPNYVDTAYSAHLVTEKVNKAHESDPIYKFIPFGFAPYYVSARVEEAYKGNIRRGESIKILVYLTAPFKTSLEDISESFIASFCRSREGIFYTSRDFVLMAASEENRRGFRRVSEQGTDYEGPGDCSNTNYSDLNPDTHYQEDGDAGL